MNTPLPAFHGSYRPEDVEFLLKPLALDELKNLGLIKDTEAKEELIQSGKRHYSEMLSLESLPSARYRRLFFEAHQRNRDRMAQDCLTLARRIAESVDKPVLVSLARAGTPIGAILSHTLRLLTGRAAPHYSVSIIRDRGIDARALDTILERGADENSLVFVDGWTGKGVIAEELHSALTSYNASRGTGIAPRLFVLADLAGKAFCAASADDYLIPSSILNATISGLVSRSVLNETIGPEDFHGCVLYQDFADQDLSVWFVDNIMERIRELWAERPPLPPQPDALAQVRRNAAFLTEEMRRYGVTDRNLIKPGIGEATRVLLRRLPERLILKNPDQENVQHLLALAQEKQVPVEVRPDLLVNALSLIRSTKHV